jgi:hypothetical protein
LREFKVRNDLVVILACLYVVHALFSGAWVVMQWNFAFALLMLAGGTHAALRLDPNNQTTLNNIKLLNESRKFIERSANGEPCESGDCGQ